MSRTRLNNDPELDDFLRRTHEIDDQRKSHRKNDLPPMKPKPSLFNQMNQFNEKDLNEARNILQDSDLIEFNEEMVIDGSDQNDNNLSYKSAYNYEKTFSPKKKNYSLDELDLEKDTNESISITNSRKDNCNNQDKTDDKTFSVSKEDFLLLQRLKKGNMKEHQLEKPNRIQASERSTKKVEEKLEAAEHEISPRKQTMPSRGKPRSESVKVKYNVEIDLDAPSLPARRTQEKDLSEKKDDNTMFTRRFNKINYNREEEPAPPKLPIRPAEHVTVASSKDLVELESEDESDKPALPTRSRARIPQEEARKPFIPSRGARAKKEIPTIDRSTKYNAVKELESRSSPMVLTNVAPEPITIIDLISNEEEEVEKHANEKLVPSKREITSKSNMFDDKPAKPESVTGHAPPPPPTSRKPHESVSFLTSLNKNKLTETHDSLPATPKKKVALQGMDYLDSVQLKSPSPQASPNNDKMPSPMKPKISKIPRSESFIDSALNSKLDVGKKSNTSPLVKEKPKLPVKPTKLSNEKVNEEPTQLRSFKIVKNEKHDIPNKKLPVVPPKSKLINFETPKSVNTTQSKDSQKERLQNDNKIEMPKLRSVNDRDTGKKQAPGVPKRKPTIPEALINGQKLKKTDVNLKGNKSITTGESAESQPEALLKMQNLAKSKVKPAVPQRKVSLPEALKRANQLKSKRDSTPLDTSTNIVISTDQSLETINDRLESMIALRQRNTFSGSNTPSVPTPIRRSQTTISSNSTPGSSTPLVHVTKGRAKGPKRKLPSKI
ncbi:binding protein of synaptojanin polyphosphoinositide phosphatase domain [Maudiozyma exigua]|uniref:Binding protein of synaptojanin polyphosphoinositide phosphatase domain n=1 Tax=Maudiozyma exigua TaxID=34358 RepID=A0A9P6VZ10_MAUEX|nr:binding protein of synaptojanin polyphosphoinositide phosphatase domain [Kazachstania exigua]